VSQTGPTTPEPPAGATPEPTGRPGRHERSTGGLIGALIVTVAVVVAFVVFRSVFRDDVGVSPEPVDLDDAVAGARDAGIEPVHPDPLPAGWSATSVEVTPGTDSVWAIGLLTPEGDFVGLRQEEEAASSLLSEHVDEDAREIGPVDVEADVGGDWTAYDDAGGDTGFVTEVGEETLLVYGSAPSGEIQGFLSLLRQ
jgi:hypothetical protein